MDDRRPSLGQTGQCREICPAPHLTYAELDFLHC